MGWQNTGSWSNAPSWSNAAPAWSNSGTSNPWSNVSPGVSWGNVPWSNQSPGIISPGTGWSNVSSGGGGTTPTPTAPTPTVTVYDTITGQAQQVSQKIADAMIAQGSVRYAPTPTSPTFKSTEVPKISTLLTPTTAYKTDPETAKQIAEMLKSPTAQFTEKSAQEAFKIISEAGISLKERDIQAKLVTFTPEQRRAEKQYYEKTGKVFTPETTVGDIMSATGKTEQELIDIGLAQKTSTFRDPISQFMQEQGQFQFKEPVSSEELGRSMSKLEGVPYLFSNFDVTAKLYTGLATDVSRFFGLSTPEQSEKATSEFFTALGEAKRGYEGLSAQEATLKYGLESPLTALIPVGVGFKIGGTVGKYALTRTAAAIGEKTVAGKLALGTAKYGETAVGLGFLGAAGVDIATTSKTPSEAFGKTVALGISLPGAMLGYKGTEFVGKQVPTPQEFFRFTTGKAEPLIESKPVEFISEKTPQFVKSTIEPVMEKITREPSAKQLMTPSVRAIYESEKLTPQAREMIESGIRLEYLLKETPPEQLVPIEFSSPKYGGRIGESLKSEIMKKPKEFVVGGSTSVGAFVPEFRRGADWDIYAKRFEKSVSSIEKLAKEEYPGSKIKPKKSSSMVTIAQESGESIVDIHKMTDYTSVGEPIKSGLGKEGVLGFKEIETIGRGKRPITVEKIQYLDPVEQLTRKLHGTTKYIARKTVEKPGHVLTGRGKDVPDFMAIAESLGRSEAKVSPKKAAKISKEITKFKKAEATKMYSGVPVSPEAIDVALEYGYEYGKGVGKSIKEKPPEIPVLVKPRPSEYYQTPEAVKSTSEYYITTKPPEVVKMVGDYYPPTKATKKEGGYYPPAKKDAEYYPPAVTPDVYPPPIVPKDTGYYPPLPPKKAEFPRPYLDRFYYPPLDSEIPVDEVFMKKEDGKETEKKYKRKHKEIVKRKFRASPIFEGAEKLFEVTPVSPLGTPRTSQVKRKVVKGKYKKIHKKSKKKEFWDV